MSTQYRYHMELLIRYGTFRDGSAGHPTPANRDQVFVGMIGAM
ncbi:MAG TPA: hypothetical protein PLW68_15205 [Casimicrobiaceae bacterium]|nr:hypothetical protein [Casimicrobiaceae bacterium]